MRWAWILAVGLILFGLLPLISLSAVSAIAALAGCEVNEGSAQTCLIAGVDWGGALHAMMVAGWLFFLTAPIALAGILLGIGLALAALIRRARD